MTMALYQIYSVVILMQAFPMVTGRAIIKSLSLTWSQGDVIEYEFTHLNTQTYYHNPDYKEFEPVYYLCNRELLWRINPSK